MRQRLIYIVVTLTSLSCLTKPKTDFQSKNKNDTTDICYWHDIKREITPDNNYIDFKRITTDKYFLEWGNKNLTRVLSDTFYCESPLTSRPTFVKENEKYIVLRFGCGSPCWGTIFLPLNENQEPETILYQYDIDLERDLVVYLDSSEENPTITIFNLLTKKKIKHKVDLECESAIPTYCIDSLSINGDKVFYRWTSNFKTNKKDERTIKIE